MTAEQAYAEGRKAGEEFLKTFIHARQGNIESARRLRDKYRKSRQTTADYWRGWLDVVEASK